MAFDPTKFGATPVSTGAGFDPSKFGAKPVASANTGAPSSQSVVEAGINAGLESASNLPSSAYNFGKGLYETVRHPVDTLTNIGDVFLGGVNKAAQKVVGTPIRSDKIGQEASQKFVALAAALKDRYGSLENLQKTATTDPFGFGSDVLSVLEGGASLAGKTELLNSGISKTAGLITKPVSKIAGGVVDTTSKVAGFGVSQATGLSPKTLSTIASAPSEFSAEALANNDRLTLANSVKKSIDTRLADLRSTGKEYDSIRKSGTTVVVPPDLVSSTLRKYGLELVDGKIKTTAESVPISPGDKTALENFISVYGNEPELSSNAFLNTRSAASDGAKYDATKTANGQQIFRDLRSQYDTVGKDQIPGLKELDAKYAPEVAQLKQIKKDYLDKNGDFKDGSINKIANLTGAGKDQVLARLEAIHPGVTHRIEIVKAAEDIEHAAGLKVGTYARSIGIGAQIATGNIPTAVITAILTSPKVAVPLVRAYGMSKAQIGAIAHVLREAGNDVNNFRLPGRIEPYVKEYMKNPKLGLSMQDVSLNSWGGLQKQNPDLFNNGILRKSLKPMGAKVEIPQSVHSVQGEWQNYGQYDEIPAKNVYETKDRYGYYIDKEGNTITDIKTGNPLKDEWNNDTGEWSDATISNEQLRNKLLDSFSTEEGKVYLKRVIEALPKNPDGTVTAYRIGNIGEGPQSYTLSEGMAKTFSNQGTDILPAGTPGLPTAGYKEFGKLPTNMVKIDPKGIRAWNPYDAEILVEPKYVKTKTQLTNIKKP